MNRDHYRKALTSYGPHTADYMVTRLVRMAKALKTGEGFVPHDALAPFAAADEVRQETEAQALGRAAGAAYDGWTSALPNDVGPPALLAQPQTITRFDAATVEWLGGSNAVDNPTVHVERLDDAGAWQPYADQSGEIQTKVEWPQGAAGVAKTYAGAQEWHWTANFEAYDGFPATLGQVRNGTYRFVIDGAGRQAGEDTPYHLESATFDVEPWSGITISDLAVNDGQTSFVVDPITYPRTYDSLFRYVKDTGDPRLCKTCSFRPWATTGTAASVAVDVVDEAGTVIRTVDAEQIDGRWVADTALVDGEYARIDSGGVRDTWRETNAIPYTIAADGSIPLQIVTVGGGSGATVTSIDPEPTLASLPISSSRPPAVAFPIGGLVVLATLGLIVRRNKRCDVS
jgi:hypothetical protein